MSDISGFNSPNSVALHSIDPSSQVDASRSAPGGPPASVAITILDNAVANPAAARIVDAATSAPAPNDDRTSRWALRGAAVGAFIGAAFSIPVALVVHHNEVEDLSASPFRDVKAKTLADLKAAGISLGGTAAGAIVGAAAGYTAASAADLGNRIVRWWNS